MRKIIPLIFLLVVQVLFAQEDAPAIYRSTRGNVSFVSDAPLEVIKARSNDLKGLLRPEDRTFAFTIQTRSFKGFNSPLQQEHFYENYIESSQYPEAHFSGKIIEPVDLTKPSEYTVRAKGILDIHGVKKERVIKVNIMVTNDTIIARSEFDVLLEDHNITIPKMVFQKIADQIHVTVEVEFQPTK